MMLGAFPARALLMAHTPRPAPRDAKRFLGARVSHGAQTSAGASRCQVLSRRMRFSWRTPLGGRFSLQGAVSARAFLMAHFPGALAVHLASFEFRWTQLGTCGLLSVHIIFLDSHGFLPCRWGCCDTTLDLLVLVALHSFFVGASYSLRSLGSCNVVGLPVRCVALLWVPMLPVGQSGLLLF